MEASKPNGYASPIVDLPPFTIKGASLTINNTDNKMVDENQTDVVITLWGNINSYT